MPACESTEADTLYQLRPLLARLTANLSHCYSPNTDQGVHFSLIVYANDIHQMSNEKVVKS